MSPRLKASRSSPRRSRLSPAPPKARRATACRSSTRRSPMARARSPPTQVRDMLGLADRGRIRRLLDTMLTGDAAATLAQLDEAHSLGIEPGSLLRGLMESLHAVTRAKAGAAADALNRPRNASRAGARRRDRLGQPPPPVAVAAQGPAGRRHRARSARGGDDGPAPPDPCRRYARSGDLARLAR